MIYTRQKPPLGSLINWAHPLAKGLVGCWLINEGSGNKIINLVDNTLVTLFSAIKRSPDGVKVNSQLITFYDFGSAKKISFSAICKSYYVSTVVDVGFIMGTNAAGTGTTFLSWKDEAASETLAIYNASDISYGSVVVPNNWYNIALTNDVVSNKYKGYLNGVIDGELAAVTADTRFISVGHTKLNDGELAFFHLYNRALTAQEVQQLYINPYAMFEQRPVWMDYVAAAVGNRRRRLLLTRRAA